MVPELFNPHTNTSTSALTTTLNSIICGSKRIPLNTLGGDPLGNMLSQNFSISLKDRGREPGVFLDYNFPLSEDSALAQSCKFTPSVKSLINESWASSVEGGGGFYAFLLDLFLLFSSEEVPITLFTLAMKPLGPENPLLELDEA